MTSLSKRTLNVLLALDETANAVLGGRPRETISGTVGRSVLQTKPPIWAKPAMRVIDGVFGRGHCVINAVNELHRRGS